MLVEALKLVIPSPVAQNINHSHGMVPLSIFEGDVLMSMKVEIFIASGIEYMGRSPISV